MFILFLYQSYHKCQYKCRTPHHYHARYYNYYMSYFRSDYAKYSRLQIWIVLYSYTCGNVIRNGHTSFPACTHSTSYLPYPLPIWNNILLMSYFGYLTSYAQFNNPRLISSFVDIHCKNEYWIEILYCQSKCKYHIIV